MSRRGLLGIVPTQTLFFFKHQLCIHWKCMSKPMEVFTVTFIWHRLIFKLDCLLLGNQLDYESFELWYCAITCLLVSPITNQNWHNIEIFFVCFVGGRLVRIFPCACDDILASSNVVMQQDWEIDENLCRGVDYSRILNRTSELKLRQSSHRTKVLSLLITCQLIWYMRTNLYQEIAGKKSKKRKSQKTFLLGKLIQGRGGKVHPPVTTGHGEQVTHIR